MLMAFFILTMGILISCGDDATDDVDGGGDTDTDTDADAGEDSGLVASFCGDNVKDDDEACDGTVGLTTCADVVDWYTGDALACDASCNYDTTGCTKNPPQITSIPFLTGSGNAAWNWPAGYYSIKAIYVNGDGEHMGTLSTGKYGNSPHGGAYPIISIEVAVGVPTLNYYLRVYRIIDTAAVDFTLDTPGLDYADYACDDAGVMQPFCSAGTTPDISLYNTEFN